VDQNTMFDPLNFWGSFNPPNPTVPAPLHTIIAGGARNGFNHVHNPSANASN